MNSPDSISRGRVLFADDDRAARDGVAELLRRHGFECRGVQSGVEALEELRTDSFDALIADIHMPGNDRLELIATVPQVAAGLPVILLTGRPSVETAARSVRLSVVAYLTKPTDVEELCVILDSAIANYRNYRAIEAARSRVSAWDEELTDIAKALRLAPNALPGGPMASYLRVMLKHAVLILSDVERATEAVERMPSPKAALLAVDHVAAIRHTIQVLEHTRQNFKSKELADLRKKLEIMLEKSES